MKPKLTKQKGKKMKMCMHEDKKDFIACTNCNPKKKEIQQVCYQCGVSANVLTCLKKYGMPPKKLSFDVSTYCTGYKCDYCGEEKATTEARDFFYPDFSLLAKYKKS